MATPLMLPALMLAALLLATLLLPVAALRTRPPPALASRRSPDLDQDGFGNCLRLQLSSRLGCRFGSRLGSRLRARLVSGPVGCVGCGRGKSIGLDWSRLGSGILGRLRRFRFNPGVDRRRNKLGVLGRLLGMLPGILRGILPRSTWLLRQSRLRVRRSPPPPAARARPAPAVSGAAPCDSRAHAGSRRNPRPRHR